LEYALNTHPLTPGPSPVVSDLVWVVSDEYLRLSVPKNPDATNLTYIIEVSDQLAADSWSSLDTTVEEDTASRLTVRDNVSVSTAPRRFIRLRVRSNP
jgi:hypothetical protein